jgi:hypothetical protein
LRAEGELRVLQRKGAATAEAAGDRTAFLPRDLLPPPAATGNAAPACANVAENRRLFQRIQETGFTWDCVVGAQGLEPWTR